jgi:cytochrome b561
VDESCPGTAGAFFPSLGPRRHRLPRAVPDGRPPDLAWYQSTPALPADTSRWQRIAARVSHGALYAVTILVAMLGWAHSGAHTPDYANWFGLFRVPQITSPDRAAAVAYEDRHIFFAYVLLALIVIHIAATVWHQFVKRDRVASRMMDGASGSSF